MIELFVYQLRFDEPRRLEEAFHSLMDVEDLEACSIEPEEQSLRFMAPSDLGTKLVEQMYHHGGLRWCSRHPIRPGAGGAVAGRPSSA